MILGAVLHDSSEDPCQLMVPSDDYLSNVPLHSLIPCP